MREQMEKEEQEKKKDEYDINRSKFEIAGEYFSIFTLNLTQQILDIQKDKTFKKKNQEHTPIHKETLKEKVIDYSKESIEKRVKKCKLTERDHNDSNFIYPK